MKQKLLFLLVLLLTATTGAWAQTQWTSGDCTVTLNNGTLTVSGNGAMEDYQDTNYTPWYGYRSDIETIVIESGVTSIGNFDFSRFVKLESVSIPASVTSIGKSAFGECGSEATTALTVSFAEGSTPLTIGEAAFNYANLKSIDIPNRVTSIGISAFASCSNLESVSIPASVTSIGAYAFGYCGKLAKVYIYAHSLETYGDMAFDYNAAGRKIYVLPDAVDTYKAGWSAYAADIEAMPTYAVTLAEGTEDADKWTISPAKGLEGGETVTATYSGEKKVKSVKAVKKAKGNIVDLSTLTEAYEAQTLDILTGTTSQLITIAAGATVTLKDAAVVDNQIACAGNATIILADGSTNTVTAPSEKAGIQIGGTSTTLTINAETAGTGKLNVKGGDYSAGIGTNEDSAGGNIVINGGTVTATGGAYAAGIGTGPASQGHINTCGAITINGGTVTATGGDVAAGIGTGYAEKSTNTCGAITIGTGVTSVTATKGGTDSPNSIGKGYNNGGTQNCGTITIGGTVYPDGVTTSPFTYTPSN